MIVNPYRFAAAGGGLSADPLHWWDLNDGSGNSWADDGTGADWTLSETGGDTVLSATSGPGGQNVAEFTGIARHLIKTSVAWDGSGEDFTFAAWARLETMSGSFRCISQHKPLGTPWNYQMTVANSTPDFPRMWYADDAGDVDNLGDTGSTVNLNTWHHYAFTWLYSSQLATLYFDGTSVATKTMTTIHTRETSAVDFYIGGSPNAYWDGQIGMVGLWDAELTADDIDYLYNGGSGRSYAEL